MHYTQQHLSFIAGQEYAKPGAFNQAWLCRTGTRFEFGNKT